MKRIPKTFPIFQCLLALMVLISAFIRFIPIWQGNFWFTFDNARDYLWVRDIVVLGRVYLIGPWSSLGGVFFGPGWYYFLAIPFILSAGNPSAAAVSMGLIILICAIVAYIWVMNEFSSVPLAVLTAFFILFSTLLLQFTFVAFHANVLPLITLVLIISLYKIRKHDLFLIATFLLLSLSFHFEPVYGLAAMSGSILFLLYDRPPVLRKRKMLFIACVFFIIPFIPQIVFELRHNLLETKSVVLYFQGKNKTLEGYLPLSMRTVNRLDLLIQTWNRTFGNNLLVSGCLLGIMVVYLSSLNFNKGFESRRRLMRVLISLLVGIFLFLVIYPEEAKAWYVAGVPIIYCLSLALAIEWLLVNFHMIFLTYAVLAIVFFVMIEPWLYLFAGKKKYINDPSIFFHQNEVVDFIYRDTRGKGFSVYTYTPGVYDYPYQYLFWWRSATKHTYLPADLAYLPDKPPDYVPNKHLHEARLLAKKSEMIYLIVEREPQYQERLETWYSTFDTRTVPIKRKNFSFGVFVEKRLQL